MIYTTKEHREALKIFSGITMLTFGESYTLIFTLLDN